MEVFMDTGGGDIYGGESKEAILAAIKKDIGEKDFKKIKHGIFEVPGSTPMRMENEDESLGDLSTLEEEYTEGMGAYCIASTNC